MDIFLFLSIFLNLFVACLKSFRKALITTIGNLKIMYHTWALRDVRSKRRSLFTLVISPYEQIPDVIGKLGRSINICTTIDDGCAVEAIKLAQEKLGNYERVPENGLIIYAGKVYTDDGAKGVAIGFEPFKLIYAPSNWILDRFYIEALTKLLEPDNVGIQAVGWVQNVITQALGWVRNVVQIFVPPLVVLVVKSFVLLFVDLVVVLAACNVQVHGWVQNVITQALGWVRNVITALLWVQIFVRPLVVLVVKSFVLLYVDLVMVLAACNDQYHGWVQNVITQALGLVRDVITLALHWVFFVLVLVVSVGASFVRQLEDLVVVLAAYNVQDLGWVQDQGWVQSVTHALRWVQIVITQALLLVLTFVLVSVLLVVRSFVLLLMDLVLYFRFCSSMFLLTISL